MSSQKVSGAEKEPRWKLFRKTRGGVALTKEEVKEIKEGRKKLRKEMKERGIYTKYEFEATASALGLYFDKRRWFLIPLLFGGGRWIWTLLGAALLAILALLGMSAVSQMRGYFTINLSDRLFRQGFTLSETVDFAKPSTQLFAEPAVDVPCISITDLGADIDSYEGQHNGFGYFAYTYYIRNEGDATVDYSWELRMDGESLNLSSAAWIMVFEDGEMKLYAEKNADGSVQTVPGQDDDSRGYLEVPVMTLAKDPTQFLQPIKTVGERTYNRIITIPFADEDTVTTGLQTEVAPMEIHKYTVVIWLEGDDPDCTDALIGGHLGLNMQFTLIDEEEENKTFWQKLWDSLTFWDN